MPEEDTDIELPRAAREISFFGRHRRDESESVRIDDATTDSSRRLGVLAPFAGVLSGHPAVEQGRFSAFAYLVLRPFVVHEHTETVREVQSQPSTQSVDVHSERERVLVRMESRELPSTRRAAPRRLPWAERPDGQPFSRTVRLVTRTVGSRGVDEQRDRPTEERDRPTRARRVDRRHQIERIEHQRVIDHTTETTPAVPPSTDAVRRDVVRLPWRRPHDADAFRAADPSPGVADTTSGTRADETSRGRERRRQWPARQHLVTLQTHHLAEQRAEQRAGTEQSDTHAPRAKPPVREVSHPIDRQRFADRVVGRRSAVGSLGASTARFVSAVAGAAHGVVGSPVEESRRPPVVQPTRDETRTDVVTRVASDDSGAEPRVRDVLREVRERQSARDRVSGHGRSTAPPESPGPNDVFDVYQEPPALWRELRLVTHPTRADTAGGRSAQGDQGTTTKPARFVRTVVSDRSTWSNGAPAGEGERAAVAFGAPPSERVAIRTGEETVDLVHRRSSSGPTTTSAEPESLERNDGARRAPERRRQGSEPYSSTEQHISALESLTNRHMAADPTLDRLVDHLFARFERKLRVERERRGR